MPVGSVAGEERPQETGRAIPARFEARGDVAGFVGAYRLVSIVLDVPLDLRGVFIHPLEGVIGTGFVGGSLAEPLFGAISVDVDVAVAEEVKDALHAASEEVICRLVRAVRIDEGLLLIDPPSSLPCRRRRWPGSGSRRFLPSRRAPCRASGRRGRWLPQGWRSPRLHVRPLPF